MCSPAGPIGITGGTDAYPGRAGAATEMADPAAPILGNLMSTWLVVESGGGPMRVAIPAVAALILTGSVASYAGEGRIPIIAPMTITKPGHYVLLRNITGSNGPLLSVTVPDVVIDMNGFTLNGRPPGYCEWPGTAVVVATVQGVTLRDGTVRGCRGVDGVTSAENLVVETEFNGITNTQKVVGCRISAKDGVAISVSYPPALGEGGGALIADNAITMSDTGIVLGNVNGGIVKGNVVSAASFYCAGGILVSGGTRIIIEKNSVRAGTCAAIEVGASLSLISDNVAFGSEVGISSTGDGNRIVGNLIRGASGIALSEAAANNHLEGNQLMDCDCGLRVLNAQPHTYRNNVGGGNHFTGAACFPESVVDLGGNHGL